jgi:hypothetical protein
MAEITEKKPRAPRKPKASKVNLEEITLKDEIKGEMIPKEKLNAEIAPVVAVLNPENPQDLEPIQPILKEENPQSLEPIQTEVADVEEIAEKAENKEDKLSEIKEEVAKKEEKGVSTPEKDFEEITELLANNQAPLPVKPEKENIELQFKKLNPNLEDGKSKWSFQVIKDHLAHEVFRGSLLKAHKWAENYCLKYNLDVKSLQKIRK